VLVSVVIPVHAEADAVVPVLDETVRCLDAAIQGDYEIIVVDDGGAGDALRLARTGHPTLRVLRHARPAGLSGALRTGVAAARGTWIALGDGWNPPADIPAMLGPVAGEGNAPALVAGMRYGRPESLLVRRDIFPDLPWFDGMHRHLPALVQLQGGRMACVPLNQPPRLKGGSDRARLFGRLSDLSDRLGIVWLRSRTRLPGRVVEERDHSQ
jgi:dolichol-phosphate mannosyltransferase